MEMRTLGSQISTRLSTISCSFNDFYTAKVTRSPWTGTMLLCSTSSTGIRRKKTRSYSCTVIVSNRRDKLCRMGILRAWVDYRIAPTQDGEWW